MFQKPGRSLEITKHAVQTLCPVASSLAVITLADLRDAVSILVALIGAVCTILVTIHKLRRKS